VIRLKVSSWFKKYPKPHAEKEAAAEK